MPTKRLAPPEEITADIAMATFRTFCASISLAEVGYEHMSRVGEHEDGTVVWLRFSRDEELSVCISNRERIIAWVRDAREARREDESLLDAMKGGARDAFIVIHTDLSAIDGAALDS